MLTHCQIVFKVFVNYDPRSATELQHIKLCTHKHANTITTYSSRQLTVLSHDVTAISDFTICPQTDLLVTRSRHTSRTTETLLIQQTLISYWLIDLLHCHLSTQASVSLRHWCHNAIILPHNPWVTKPATFNGQLVTADSYTVPASKHVCYIISQHVQEIGPFLLQDINCATSPGQCHWALNTHLFCFFWRIYSLAHSQ